MKIYDFYTPIEKGLLKDVPMAISIGVFDGVHLGHREIFSRLAGYASGHEGVRTMVMTFATNPKVEGSRALDTMRLRTRYISSFGIDYVVVIDFSRDFSKMSGREFIRLLCTMCRVKAVIVGEDFRCGSPSDQITAGELSGTFAGFGVGVDALVIPPVEDACHRRISSTHIRALVSQGDLDTVRELSGQPYQYDLLDNRFVRTAAGYRTRIVTDQRLPADGSYRASVVLLDGREVEASLIIDRDGLLIVPRSGIDLVKADSLRIFSKEN